MTTIACGCCRHQFDIGDELIGKTVECPSCQARMQATAPVPATVGADEVSTVPPRTGCGGKENVATVPPASPSDGAPVQGPAAADAPASEVKVPGYEMLGVLGRGGMGVVYQARHIRLNRRVALKMILAGSHAAEQDLARFQTEAQAIARLQHPHIVQVHEIGEHEGTPFFSLEFCAGGSLAQKLAGTPMPAQAAAALVETLARAMQVAHDHNVIHRDLKPANVLLTAAGEPKITDFGLAKKLDEAGQTQAGVLMGTPSYMAPEQAEGWTDGVGPAADVYALGAILYECLTGRPPFRAATTLETVMQVVSTEPVPPTQLQPKTPRDLETICLRCLAKGPHRRYPSARELADDLRRFQAGEPIRARPVGALEKAVKWVRRRPAVAGLMAAVLLVTLAGIGAFAWAFARSLQDRDVAITARNNQETEKKSAENARDRLAQALVETESARLRAETERGKADKARIDAETERGKADKARIKAESAEKERARQLWLAERFLYHSQFSEAYNHLQSNNLVDCRLALDQTSWHLRGPEFGYLTNLLRDKWRVIHAHGGTVKCLQLAPSGKTLLSASSDSTIKVWDLDRDAVTHVLRGDASGFHDLAVSPDGKRLYSRDYMSTVREWDLETGQQTRTLFAHPDVMASGFVAGTYRRLALSRDGRRLAAVIEPHPFPKKAKDALASPIDQIKVWNLETGKEAFTLTAPRRSLGSLEFSPDGKRLFSTSNVAGKGSEIKGWDAETGKEALTLRDATDSGTMVVAPDGKRLYLASARGPFINVWDLESKTRKVLQGHAEMVRSLALSADGKRLCSGSYDGFIKIWDLTIDKEIGSLRGQRDAAESLALSADGQRLFAGGHNGIVSVWNLGATDHNLPMVGGQAGQAICSLLTADGATLITGCTDRAIRVWDLQGKKPVVTLRGHAGAIYDLAMAPNGRRLVSSGSDVKVWDLDSGKERSTLPFPRVPPLTSVIVGLPPFHPGSIVVSNDGKRLFWAGTDAIRCWDVDAGKETFALAEPRANRLAVSADGKRLFAGKSGMVINVWDLETGKLALSLKGHRHMGRPNRMHMPLLHALAVSHDSKRLFSAGPDRTIKVWDVQTGAELMTLSGHTDDVLSLAVSADGKRLFSGSLDQSIILWDLELRREILTLRGHPSYVAALALTHDGKRLLSMSSRPMAWDLDPGREIATLRGHKGAVDSLLLAPDGTRLISASVDRTARIWDIQTGSEVLTLGQEQPAEADSSSRLGTNRLALSADGKRLFLGRGNAIQMWDLREAKELGTLKVDAKVTVSCLARSADGQRLFAGTTDGIKAWDLATGREVADAPYGGLKRVSCLVAAPDGKLFSDGMETASKPATGSPGLVSIIKGWDLKKTGAECLSLPSNGKGGANASLALAPDGQRLFVGSADFRTDAGGEISEWNLKTGKQTRVLSGALAPITSLLLSADGRRLITGDGSGAIAIWNLGTGTPMLTLRGHQGGVLGLALSPDHKRLFSASGDHTIKVWDVAAELSLPE